MARRRWRISRYSGTINIPEEERIPCEATLVWKAKHERKPLSEQTVQIRCLGKMHKIRFRFPGCITLLNHTDKRGELTMMKLGGDKPECIKLLEDWAKGQKDAGNAAYSRPIVQRFLQARQDWGSKRKQIRQSYQDWLLHDLKTRLLTRVERINHHLRHLIKIRFENEEEREYRTRFNHNRSVVPPEPDKIIRPIINLRFQDLINHREDRVDEAGN